MSLSVFADLGSALKARFMDVYKLISDKNKNSEKCAKYVRLAPTNTYKIRLNMIGASDSYTRLSACLIAIFILGADDEKLNIQYQN